MVNFINKYKWIILIVSVLTFIGSIILIPQTDIDPEIRNYIPESIESRLQTDMIEKNFGVQEMVVVMFSDSCILTPDNLIRIKNIDRYISKITGVTNRVSPFTVKSIKSEEGMMLVNPLIKEIPEDSAGLKYLAKDILDNRFARNVVFSEDLTTGSITVTINDAETETKTLNKIDSLINAYPGKARVLKGGLPYIRQSLLNDVKRDALILIPVALIIMLLVLKVNLGTWKSVTLPFSVVILTTAFSLALIPLLGWKISIITVLVPVILIAVANNYGIYLVARFQDIYRRSSENSEKELTEQLLKSLKVPILFSGLTTIAGILGLLTHSIVPAKQIGVLAAIGVSAALLMSLFLIPAMILIAGAKLIPKKPKNRNKYLLDDFLSRLSQLIIKYPSRIIVISGAVILVLFTGITNLKINTNQENYFSSKHPVRQASELINSKFGGSQSISVMISGDIKDPAIMQRIDFLTNEIEKEKGVGNVFSISQVVREMSKSIYTKDEAGYNRIPDSREAIAQMFELYNMSGNPEDFKQLMDIEYSRAQILIRLSEPENAIIKSVKARISELTRNFPAEVNTGGYALIMDDFARSIIKGQISSLLFAVITVFILLSMIFRSFKGGLIGSIPLIASILILFGFMGYSKIALDAATALLSSIMIGVGVDFTIQYIWCYNLQIRKGLSINESTRIAMKTIGRSIIINALTVTTGFAALIISGFTSIRFFGYLVIISIGSCLAGALLVIPSILIKYKPSFIGFETIKTKKHKYEKDTDISGITAAAFSGSSTTA